MKSLRTRLGIGLLELIIAGSILLVCMGMFFQWQVQTKNKAEGGLTDRLALQMDARKAADALTSHLRECSEVVRPYPGESRPWLLTRDSSNQTNLLYLDADVPGSKRAGKSLFRLLSYTSDFSGTFRSDREKVLADSIEQLTFTTVSPTGVQLNATLANH